jgi:hypothetical protein
MAGLTELQKQKQIKFRANLTFGHGRISLLNSAHKVQLYQDDLEVVFDLFRDTSFKASIVNKSVGVNVIDVRNETKKEIIVKHVLPKANQIQEEIKEIDRPPLMLQLEEDYQWKLEIEKKGTLDTGFITDILF